MREQFNPNNGWKVRDLAFDALNADLSLPEAIQQSQQKSVQQAARRVRWCEPRLDVNPTRVDYGANGHSGRTP